ncbi:hypothetical protein SAMN05428642_1021024 [Flaviramulus basaltis]|uniref:BP74 N-terminal domain-containing protein n=1 Tax=Flaviramulus basaltis TaxID=369401 RepID=A0A1K2IK95_9FLAO|nr:hypothetical protein [Flaviramulus basaltis]SFZ92828.1 hypothetical protein SAMN05428642_1021024 [Flaviramulus basaltis]
MKKIFFSLLIIMGITALFLTSCNKDDDNTLPTTKRYFRFKSCPENTYGNWQDTSFVAATSNPFVIQQCLDQLKLPLESRKFFPLGKIDEGSLGYNKNGMHSFNWHFAEDSWEMVELGIEIYDGCAYSNVELNNYSESLGSYGGWGNRILEEITNH